MKRFLLFVALFTLGLFVQAQEIEVPKTQIPMITKISASWCPHCGNWGWNFFEGLLEGYQEKAIMMVTHYSGDYKTPAGEAMASNFGIVGQPEFYMGTEKISANSGNFSNMIPMVGSNINTMANQAPRAQSAINLGMLPDGVVKVQARAQFFEKTTGEFYLGIYIVEKNFVGYQSPLGGNAEHKNLFRGSIDNNDFGELLMAGSIDADQVFDRELSFNLNATGYESSNVDIVSILWEKVGDRYEYVNANSSDNFEIVSASKEVEQRVSLFQVSPNPMRANAIMELSLEKPLEQVATDLLTITGERVQAINIPDFLAAGDHRLPMAIEKHLTPGVYILRLQSTQGMMNRRIVIQ